MSIKVIPLQVRATQAPRRERSSIVISPEEKARVDTDKGTGAIAEDRDKPYRYVCPYFDAGTYRME